MKRKITIIICCYNGANRIGKVLEYIYNQKELEIYVYEIIVVDDSTEIKEHELDNCEIIYVRNKKNMGVQYSRNKGLENANYKYILMLDGDDMLDTADKYQGENSYIDKSIDILEKNNNIAFTQCISNMFGDFEGYTISSYKITEKLAVHKHHIPLFIIYRRIDGIKCGGYNTKIQKWQDWSFGVYIMNHYTEIHPDGTRAYQFVADTAYVRESGTKGEHKAAEYILKEAEKIAAQPGKETYIQTPHGAFPVPGFPGEKS